MNKSGCGALLIRHKVASWILSYRAELFTVIFKRCSAPLTYRCFLQSFQLQELHIIPYLQASSKLALALDSSAASPNHPHKPHFFFTHILFRRQTLLVKVKKKLLKQLIHSLKMLIKHLLYVNNGSRQCRRF